MRDKKWLLIGVGFISILYGVVLAINRAGAIEMTLGSLLWLGLLLICLVYTMQHSDCVFDAGTILKLVAMMVVNGAVVWISPWSALTSWGSYAVGILGALLVWYLFCFTLVFCLSLLLLLDIYVVCGALIRLRVPQVIRFFLVMLAAALLFAVLTLINMTLIGALPSNLTWISLFFDGLVTMGSVGISLYYIVGVFSKAETLKDES